MAQYFGAWDIGGAHLKVACLDTAGKLVFTQQYPCPLWQGGNTLELAFAKAVAELKAALQTSPTDSIVYAVTMTGELSDCFASRQAGVCAILEIAQKQCGHRIVVYAGKHGWLRCEQACQQPQQVASANWHATALCCAREVAQGVLVDVGTTTTDIIPFAHGEVLQTWDGEYADSRRLADSTLVYSGVVRTAVMAMVQSITLDEQEFPVLAEHFANSADVYRVLEQLPDGADQYPACDGASADRANSFKRLARMFAIEVSGHEDWLVRAAQKIALAQSKKIHSAYCRVVRRHALEGRVIVGAGVGCFLAHELAYQSGVEYCDFATLIHEEAMVWSNTASAVALAKCLHARRHSIVTSCPSHAAPKIHNRSV